MDQDIERVLYSEQELASLCDSIAQSINNDYIGRDVVLVCMLKGSIMFYADLVRRINVRCILDFMAVSSYGSAAVSSGKINIKKDLSESIKGRDVIIVEDILDTGNTLYYIKDYLEKRDPASIRICTLFDKPSRRKKPITPDYTGEVIDDLFIVGYGLDYDERYRNLPYVGVLRPEIDR